MRKIGFPLGIVSLIALDQWVKAWTVATIALNEQRAFIPKIVNFYYLRNYGAAFSILQHQQWFFTLVTLIVITVAIWYFIKHIEGSLWTLWSLSLVIAGGIGNFIDRLRLGYVVDMFHLDFIDFPVFNVADMCLTVGVAVLFISIMKEENNGNKS
ncbi:signal peptidase II [Streptococcus marmotae]|uniref:signal peptidase II n=1 Tax=Streptococcus marmotae TaxID=1825069 RepID=UPI000834EBE8|nr:signal peptidase II [Streptococcus marmotae]